MKKRMALLAVVAAMLLSAGIATQGTGSAQAAHKPDAVPRQYGSTWS